MSNGTYTTELSTRLINGSFGLAPNTHDMMWIFTDVSIGNNVTIASPDGDRSYQIISSEQITTPVGTFTCWKLQYPPSNSIYWYDTDTGLVIKIDYTFGGGASHQDAMLTSTTYPGFLETPDTPPPEPDVPGFVLWPIIFATCIGIGVFIAKFNRHPPTEKKIEN